MTALLRSKVHVAILLAAASTDCAGATWNSEPRPADLAVADALDPSIRAVPSRDVSVEQSPPIVDAAALRCSIAGKSYADNTRDPADSTHCRICDPTITATAWSPASGCVITFAGTGTPGSVNGLLAGASFNKPRGMVVDGQGVLYVADEGNHAIRKIADGQVTTLVGGQGFADGPLDEARFTSPHGLALGQGGVLYVADEGNNRIRMIANGRVTTVAGNSTAGFTNGPAASAQLNGPLGIAVDRQGVLYVADWHNYCVRKLAGGQVSTFAGICASAGGFVDGAASSARFNIPSGMEVNADGAIYVADEGNNRVRLIADGKVSTVAGSAAGFTNGPGATAELDGPTNVRLEPSGALLIADMYNHAIRRLSAGQITTIAGTGTAGAADGPLWSATFNNPNGIAVWKGVAYVADGSNHCIRALRLPYQPL